MPKPFPFYQQSERFLPSNKFFKNNCPKIRFLFFFFTKFDPPNNKPKQQRCGPKTPVYNTMKSKFQNFDFGSVEVLSRDEQNKVKGGYIPNTGGGGPVGSYPSANYCYNCNCSSDGTNNISWQIQVSANGNGNMAYTAQTEAVSRCRSMGSAFSPYCSYTATPSSC
jgi:hypothetical protein